MPRALGDFNLCFACLGERADLGERAGGAAGAGVDDEAGFQEERMKGKSMAAPTPKVCWNDASDTEKRRSCRAACDEAVETGSPFLPPICVGLREVERLDPKPLAGMRFKPAS
jgi:hypothetical protein